MRLRRRVHRPADGGDVAAVSSGEAGSPEHGRAPDDEDVGWGDVPTSNDQRLSEDRPPHHDGRSSW